MSERVPSDGMLRSLGTTDPLDEIFSDASYLAAMLQFEVGLARVEARLGLIPPEAAAAIESAADPRHFDASDLARAARRSGTLTIPFVEALTARVRDLSPEAANFVHRGATSQDVSDTALILCLSRARRVLAADQQRLTATLRQLSDAHAGTVMLARTLLQPAAPTTFGLKVAGWYGAISRTGSHMSAAFDAACALQFGGPAGTLASLQGQGGAVAAALAAELGLSEPEAPWHVHRDRLASLVTACGIHVGALGKVARDLSLMMQFELREAAEPGGGSSAMPHKRNPAACAITLAAATRLPGLVASYLSGMCQEHERGVGNWHAETATIVDVVRTTGAALQAIAGAIDHLDVDVSRMRANLDATGGVIFAERAMSLLAPRLGRAVARELIETALQAARADGASFTGALLDQGAARSALSPEEIDSLADPSGYLGSAEHFRRRLLGG